MTFSSPSWRSLNPLKRVTFSPSQKGHQQNHQEYGLLGSAGPANLASKTWQRSMPHCLPCRIGGRPRWSRDTPGWNSTRPMQKENPKEGCTSAGSWWQQATKGNFFALVHGNHSWDICPKKNNLSWWNRSPPVFLRLAHARVQGWSACIQQQRHKSCHGHMHGSHRFGIWKAVSIHKVLVEGNQTWWQGAANL